MADKDGLKVAKDYHTDVPFGNQGSFHVKGANNTDWGMKRHLSNIFDPVSGNTVMFAFDHGYFMGSTAGLERLDLVIPKLQEQVDVFMGTRGAIRTCVSPTFKKGIALRVTSGSSMINDDLSHECLAVDVEDAIRMNADCMAVQTFIGADGQLSSIDNLSRCINAGMRYSIPTLGVLAVVCAAVSGILFAVIPLDKGLLLALMLQYTLPAPFIIPLFADLGGDAEYVSTTLSLGTVLAVVLFFFLAAFSLA